MLSNMKKLYQLNISVNGGCFTLGHKLDSYMNLTMLNINTSNPNAEHFFLRFVNKLSTYIKVCSCYSIGAALR